MVNVQNPFQSIFRRIFHYLFDLQCSITQNAVTQFGATGHASLCNIQVSEGRLQRLLIPGAAAAAATTEFEFSRNWHSFRK